MPSVSIIIPVCNNEKYIEKCLRSVMGQDFHSLEAVVIDDGSTDKSGEILDRLAAEDSRIRAVHQENRGVACARNLGLDMAEGKYVTFLDGDDYLEPDYIGNLFAIAEEKELEILICGLESVDEDGNVLDSIVPGPYVRFEHEEWAFRISAVCSHFYLRDVWERHGVRFSPGERGEDMPVALFFNAVCEKIGTAPVQGYKYVQHASSAMHNFRGLSNYRLPYDALEEGILKVRNAGIKNGADFHELFIMRILATCLFLFAPGASKEKMDELCRYIVRILETYCPDHMKNGKARLTAKLDIPFVQKAAVKVLQISVKTRLIYPLSAILRHLK